MADYDLEDVRKKLDSISPSFCAAKWLQVTIHLQTGLTHSCHHPSAHKIPMDELKNNPSALHNTKFKKEMRKLMLEGTRPPECNYCWAVEDLPGLNYSDRHAKSAQNWAMPYVDKIQQMPWDTNITPTYLEVSFSHVCNFKCSYCAPNISSKWMDEIKQYGEYPTSTKFNNLDWLRISDQMPIPHRDHNPYIEAFWKWWPEIYNDLKVFRITGGEPLMSKETFKVLDYFIQNPNPTLEFAVNTNLGIPEKLLDEFITKMKVITENELVKKPKIFTSIDGWGERAAYIRHGMDFKYYWNNVNRVLTELPNCDMTFMCTFNALSLTSFKEFLEGIYVLKNTYANQYRKAGVLIDTPYLRHPTHQSVKILTPDYIKYMEDMLEYVRNNIDDRKNKPRGFHDFEERRIKRIYDLMLQPESEQWLKTNRADFYRFFMEHDRRRKTNFLNTFPEMKEFWELCKKEAE